MQFSREINRLLRGVLLLFLVVALSAAYWAVVGPDTILRREDNPRLVLAEARILRGALVDRDGEVLARSTSDETGTARREYLYPETYSALGYYSLRYGSGGAEAAYDATLRGDDLVRTTEELLVSSLLHRPQRGSAVQLTLDLDVQRAVAQAMNGRTGAAILLSVPDGQVLAMISNPTYDPNQLDEQWDALRTDPGKPFFNRAVQGNYQPGGMMQTPLIAAAVVQDVSLNDALPEATRPVMLDDLRLTCAVRLPDAPLSLREAYGFACPRPFATLAALLGADVISRTIRTFHLTEPPTLPGYNATGAIGTGPAEASIPEDEITEIAVGQGALTISPLQMAVIAAAVINDGNAPQPYTLLATRAPDATEWETVQAIRPTTPYMTTNTARQVQDLMRNAVANGAAHNAGRANIDIGGHAAVAYSGEGPQAWFVGFATLGGRRGVAVAVVLENSSDTGLAADIGGTALMAAQAALVPPEAPPTAEPGAEG